MIKQNRCPACGSNEWEELSVMKESAIIITPNFPYRECLKCGKKYSKYTASVDMSSKIRPSWDEYFMSMANVAKTRSTCLRRQIGAIAVKDKRILCTGYNGAPPNTPHCIDLGCIREAENIESGTMHEKCRALHAEQNLIVQAAIHGVSLKDCSIYCTNQPCIICMKMIVGIRPERLIYENPYPDKDTIDLLNKVARGSEFKKEDPYITWEFFNWE